MKNVLVRTISSILALHVNIPHDLESTPKRQTHEISIHLRQFKDRPMYVYEYMHKYQYRDVQYNETK